MSFVFPAKKESTFTDIYGNYGPTKKGFAQVRTVIHQFYWPFYGLKKRPFIASGNLNHC